MTNGHSVRYYLLFVSLSVFALDRLTKWLVLRNVPLYDGFEVIPGFFRITHVHNRGAAFGMFADHPSEWKTAALIFFSLAALALVVGMLWKHSQAISWTAISLALILGGAIGNLWDRAFYGYVVDFLDFYFRSYHWHTFNIADSAIVVGALSLMVEILFFASDHDKGAKQDAGAAS